MRTPAIFANKANATLDRILVLFPTIVVYAKSEIKMVCQRI